jgi:tripartite-type tricarboxylate transporter receptor subunit TctC
MIGRRNVLAGLAAWCVGLAPACPLHADTYPDKPIKLVVPFPPGGATDTIARLVAQRLRSSLGQPVIVENQGGAGGTIGSRAVAGASPDGYTLLMGGVSSFATAPLLYRLDYDPVKAFAPVATIAVDQGVLVVGPALPVKTVQELVQYARAKPGQLNYGAAIGIGPQLVMEMFKRRSGADIVHVPYRGGAAVIADLLGGQIHATINNKSVLLAHIQQGKLTALAVTGATRWSELPDVPTLLEAGYMDAAYDTWFGIVVPAGTQAVIIAKLNAAINDGLRSPSLRASFASVGIEPKITTPQEFAALIAVEVPKWAAIVKATGVKVE